MPGPEIHIVSNSGARAGTIYGVRGLAVWSRQAELSGEIGTGLFSDGAAARGRPQRAALVQPLFLHICYFFFFNALKARF